MATLQWIDTALGLRLLWTEGGKLAMGPACCCNPVLACGGCPDGVPVELALVWRQFQDTPPFNPPLFSDCSPLNVAPAILEYAIPQPESVFAGAPGQPYYVIDGPLPCIYRYFYGAPIEITIEGSNDAPVSSVIGWGAELITFNSQPRVAVYPVGGDNRPWGYDPIKAPYGELYWMSGQNDPHSCNGWVASSANGFNGTFVPDGGVPFAGGNDFGCLMDGNETLSIQPI